MQNINVSRETYIIIISNFFKFIIIIINLKKNNRILIIYTKTKISLLFLLKRY